jgi:peptide methionine sulfoxide reductase msrA/msrB
MKKIILLIALFANLHGVEPKLWSKHIVKLTEQEKHVLLDKGTESAFTGKYTNMSEDGVYTCKLCGTPLYKSSNKFQSHCGWPSFDDAIAGSVKKIPDIDGKRTEIVCAKCGGHLGHVFTGEGYTAKNTRYCVNSLSLNFQKSAPKPIITKPIIAKAYFAGGCFWGVEHYLEKLNGVKSATSGFMGGKIANPTYRDVSTKDTGHIETVEVVYDPTKISYTNLAKSFFEIHDPTQANRQGPDMGDQYQSAVFVANDNERKIITSLLRQLKSNGFTPVTKILKTSAFYKAEEYHQDYYAKKKSTPYCHGYVKRFTKQKETLPLFKFFR